MAAEEVVEEAGLVYVHDDMPGLARKRCGVAFCYYWPDGKLIDDEVTLARIRSLKIPPAYEKVWICPLENGHIQATGRDARGRKQYRYHPAWIDHSTGNKFAHMAAFASALPRIRERVDHDLCKHGLPREKVLATVVWFLEKSLIRVGNEEYAKENHHYGLTTMMMRHCKVEGSVMQFHFVGKRGIYHDIEVCDRRMARIVKKIQDLPGQELFQYLDADQRRHSVSSADVNAYLKEISGDDFTAKDFRTWAATVLALSELAASSGFKSLTQAKRSVSAAMKKVARQLGNTPAICRKSYVHPGLIHAFLDRSLEKFVQDRLADCESDHDLEEQTVGFLKSLKVSSG